MKQPALTNSTMDHLADRIRSFLGDDPRITEQNMFGGLTFLLNGHMFVGCKKDGRILLSVGKENNEAALARPGATQMIHGAREMKGFVWVEADAIEDDDDLAEWVKFAERTVAARPPKEAKEAKPRKTPAKR
jgi:TfoX/Sxy family transcriptional regulator of competence genes